MFKIMDITIQEISLLRNTTGAGMNDCRAALIEANGDQVKAVEVLRKKGSMKAAKRADKIAAEGLVFSYIHGAGKIGVLLEINCETDFVAKNDSFRNFANDVAMHIAASNPSHVSREDVPADLVAKEKEIYLEQAQAEGKPKEIAEKIVEGKLNKFFSDICLLEQLFIKDEDKTMNQLITEKSAEIGEKITVRRFVRYELGEGLEKKSTDFAAEVAEQLK